jgi:hypothetical protein
VVHLRRHVFHVPGYDSVSSQTHYLRFARQLEIFAKTWNVQSTISDLDFANGFPRWRVSTAAANWKTDSEFELLAWDDLIAAESRKLNIIRVARAIVAYANLIWTGTLLRYAFANTRYFLFAIVPLLETLLLAAVAWTIADWSIANWVNPLAWPALFECGFTLFLGLGLFELLLRWPGDYLRLPQALDDWILSLDYIYSRHRGLDMKLHRFADRVAACIRQTGADEILIVGHSLGATLAIDAISRILDARNAVVDNDRICVATVGATIPKCVLHPAATDLRKKVQEIVRNAGIFWVEYQARADAISFYRFNPVTLRRIPKTDDFLGKPLVRIVQIHDMLKPETFRKFRLRVMRLHYQCVSANDRRAPYDYCMMACGPLRLPKWTRSRLGLLDFFRDPKSSCLSVN